MSLHCDDTTVATTTGGWRVLAPFKFREYRLLVAALAISIFAEGMWAVVMALQVIALSSDPTALSIVATCLGGGLVAFVLVGGLAADRFPQRSIIIVVQTVNFVATLCVAVLGAFDALRIWHMALASFALGVAAAFFFPAYSAYLPRILPADQLLAANGVEGVIRPTLQRAVGPAIAGVLVGATFPTLGAAVVTVLFGIGLALLVATRTPARTFVQEADPTAKPHLWTDLRDGFAFMVKTPWLLSTTLFASIFVLLAVGPMEVLLPFITEERFANGEQMYGFVLGAYGIGGAIGALTVSSLPMPRRYLTLMILLWAFGGLPLAVMGATHSFTLMAASSFVVGITDGAAMVVWGTLLQRRVPPAMLGRVSSLDFFVSLAFMPVSMAIAGPLSKVVSMEMIFLVAGVAPAVLGVITLYAARLPQDEIANPLD